LSIKEVGAMNLNLEQKKPITQGFCSKCNNWVDIEDIYLLRKSAGSTVFVCLECLVKKSWKYLKAHVRSKDYRKIAQCKEMLEMDGAK
jgi:hypothetical protein